MDRETKHVLNRISSNIPSRLTKNLTKVEVDTTEEEKARLALKSPHISRAKKNNLARLLDKGSFRRSKEVTDEEVVKKLDNYHTREIARARRDGRLKDPMTDPFYRNRMKRMDRIRKGLEKPKKQGAYTKAEMDKARQQLDPTINPQKYENKSARP